MPVLTLIMRPMSRVLRSRSLIVKPALNVPCRFSTESGRRRDRTANSIAAHETLGKQKLPLIIADPTATTLTPSGERRIPGR